MSEEPGTGGTTALLVIDVQREVIAAAENRNQVLATIVELVDAARQASTPVIWVQHDDEYLAKGSDGWQLAEGLDPRPDEPIIYKNYRSSFEQTSLDHELASRQVNRLVVAGAQTDFCVRWTLHGALDRGLDTVLVADAHTTDELSPAGMPNGAEIIAHTNSVWASQDSSTCSASVVPAAEVRFA